MEPLNLIVKVTATSPLVLLVGHQIGNQQIGNVLKFRYSKFKGFDVTSINLGELMDSNRMPCSIRLRQRLLLDAPEETN
jgi:hypothetical protein